MRNARRGSVQKAAGKGSTAETKLIVTCPAGTKQNNERWDRMNIRPPDLRAGSSPLSALKRANARITICENEDENEAHARSRTQLQSQADRLRPCGIRQTAARSLPRPPWPVCPAVPALRIDRGLRAPNASRTQAARKARVQRPRATLALWPVCSGPVGVAGLRPSHRFDRRSPELARLARQTASQGRHKTGSATQARCVHRDSGRPDQDRPATADLQVSQAVLSGPLRLSIVRRVPGIAVSREIAELPGTGEPDRKERRSRPPAFAIARWRIGVLTESGELFVKPMSRRAGRCVPKTLRWM